MNFERNVFVNCPFDEAYWPLLRPMLFTLIYAGLQPRIALERDDSGESRLDKIVELILSSKLSIHDLSRIKAKEKNEFARMNMPFELGIDYGVKCSKPDCDKRFLIVADVAHQYKQALSDIAGWDINIYSAEEPQTMVLVIVNWLRNNTPVKQLGDLMVWNDFNDFMTDNYNDLGRKGYSEMAILTYPMASLMEDMVPWCAKKHIERQK